jgi:hypothetical protein
MRLKVMLPVVFTLWPATAAPPDYVHLANEAYIFGYPLVIMGVTEEVWLTHN